jgi:hypothetical protein
MRDKRILLSAVALLLTSCSPRDFLTRRLATDSILLSQQFKAQQHFTLQTGVLSNKDYPSPEYLVLQHHGWISASTTPCPRDLTPPPCWDIILTPSGVDAVRSAIQPQQSSGSLVSVPVAKRTMVAITGITKQGNSADVEFTWKWAPLNEVGAALYSGDLQYKSTVAFRNYNDGWRMIEGTPRSGQSIDDALKNAEPNP